MAGGCWQCMPNKKEIKRILQWRKRQPPHFFIEPEETTELNNAIFPLENDERKRGIPHSPETDAGPVGIRFLTQGLPCHRRRIRFHPCQGPVRPQYNGNLPVVVDKAQVKLIQAYHPCSTSIIKRTIKPTIPSISACTKNNASSSSAVPMPGQTVTLKNGRTYTADDAERFAGTGKPGTANWAFSNSS